MSDRHERVRLALRRLGVSQETIAAVAGVSQSLVSRALKGEANSPRVFYAIRRLLDAQEAR